jgi:hypothetical protein
LEGPRGGGWRCQAVEPAHRPIRNCDIVLGRLPSAQNEGLGEAYKTRVPPPTSEARPSQTVPTVRRWGSSAGLGWKRSQSCTRRLLARGAPLPQSPETCGPTRGNLVWERKRHATMSTRRCKVRSVEQRPTLPPTLSPLSPHHTPLDLPIRTFDPQHKIFPARKATDHCNSTTSRPCSPSGPQALKPPSCWCFFARRGFHKKDHSTNHPTLRWGSAGPCK